MKLHAIVLFLLQHIIISTGSNQVLIGKSAFLANLVFKEFVTTVVWWHDKSDDVADFLKQFQGLIVLTPVQKGENEIIRAFNKDERSFMQTVLFASEIHEMEYFMTVISQDLVVPIRLIAVLTKPTTHAKLSKLMKSAWNNDITDILIVSPNAEDVLLSTYLPYSNGRCGDSTPVHLDSDTKDLFPRKFSNFQGCEIRTSMLHMSPYSRLKFENNTLVSISGIDGTIFKILFELLNASMNVVSAMDHGGIGTMVNGTATGSFADLVNRQADILMPAFIMSSFRYPYVQYSHSIEFVNFFWLGPRQRRISEWLRILQPFMSNITPALITSSIAFVAVTMTVNKFGLHRSFSRDSVLFQTFMVFLGIEADFETKSWLMNSLFVLWIWFCMVVRIAFQGDLVNGLQKTILEHPLRRLETAVKVVDGYGGGEGLRDFINGTRFYKDYKVIQLQNLTHYLKAIEAGKRFLLLADLTLSLDTAPNIQVMHDDPVTQIPACFYMRPGWPASTEINDLLSHMIEMGLMQNVFKMHSLEWAKELDSNDRDVKPLALDTMIGCFYGLGVSYVVCTLVLFIEILYHKVKNSP